MSRFLICFALFLAGSLGLFFAPGLWGDEPVRPTALKFKAADESPRSLDSARPRPSALRFADSSTSAAAEATAEEDEHAAEPGSPYGHDKHEKVDPIKANGPIFVDWPKPDLLLVFSGEMDGYLEPCGCAGLNNQKGGLKRRHTFLKQMREQSWPVVAVDMGGHVRRFGAQAEIKFRYALESLVTLGYDAIGFGPQDLRMDILPLAINFDDQQSPWVSANVGILDFDSGFSKRFTIIERGGLKIGITSVLGKKYVEQLKNVEDVELLEPYQAIPQILPELINAKCDYLVLLAHTDEAEAVDLARRFHEFNFVVAAKGADEPPNTAATIPGPESKLIEVGHKGMYVVAVGLYQDGPVPMRYQRVPLDHRFDDSSEMQAMMVSYQKELQTIGLEGLNLKPLKHPSGREFAGSSTCADCHFEATEVFENTPHSHATKTIVDLDPARHHDPECISCHATGWNPQKYFPYTSGYLGLEATPEMTANGCENCHGPAARHVAVEGGEIEVDEEEQLALRQALHLEIVENEGNMRGQVFGKVVAMCMECHDLDNSPDFDFQEYWPHVEHHGVD